MTAPLPSARLAEIEMLAEVYGDSMMSTAIRDLLAELRRREWQPIEPSDATVDKMARAMHDDYPHPMRQEPWDEQTDVGKIYWRGKARAAYRAAVSA